MCIHGSTFKVCVPVAEPSQNLSGAASQMTSVQVTENHITPSMAQYLLAMYCLRRENQPLIGARLAEWLGVAPASVTAMVQRMGHEGLVQLSRGKEIALTQRGWQVAMDTARRHYLAERLLTDLIGFDWALVHSEAERWQHSISGATEEKLWEALGRPTTCPHGSPIPGTGACFSPHARKLTQAAVGEKYIIERISERAVENTALLSFFQAHDLMPAHSISVKELSSVTGTIVIQTELGEAALDIRTADQIIVAPANLSIHRKAPERLRRSVG